MVTTKEIRKKKGLPEELPLPTPSTPETREQGNEYIRAREKLASQVGAKQAARIMSQQAQQEQTQRLIEEATPEPVQYQPKPQILAGEPEPAPLGIAGKVLDVTTAIFAHPFQSIKAAISPEITIQDVVNRHFSQSTGKQITQILTAAAGYAGAVVAGAALPETIGEITAAVQSGSMTAVAGGVTAKAAILSSASKLLSFKFLSLSVGGFAATKYLLRQPLSTSQTILNEELRLYDDIIKLTKIGELSFEDALKIQINIEQQIAEAERNIGYITRHNTLLWLSGGKDTLIAFRNANTILIPQLKLALINAQNAYRVSQIKTEAGIT